jgi:hypothetical protein
MELSVLTYIMNQNLCLVIILIGRDNIKKIDTNFMQVYFLSNIYHLSYVFPARPRFLSVSLSSTVFRKWVKNVFISSNWYQSKNKYIDDL